MNSFSVRHPLTVYFSMAYLIAWGAILLINFCNGLQYFHGENVLSTGISGRIMIVWLVMIAAPAIAGVFLKWIVDGKDGVKELFLSISRWKVSAGWYAAAVLTTPVLLIPIIYSFVLVSKNYIPGLLLVSGIGGGLIGGFLEETGWTGFALPKLQLKYTPFVAGIILGVIHAIWHLPADYLGSISFYKEFYVVHFLLWIVALIAFRLLVVWIYNHSKSLLLAQLTHASFTGSQLIFGPPAATAAQAVLWYGVFTAALCLVVVIIILKDNKSFFQKIGLSKT